MQIKIKKVYLILLILSTLYAQKSHLKFINYSVEQHLSQSTVKCILQDYKGFLWIGTDGGLNKFDGYKFKIYNYEMEKTNTLQSSKITALFEDTEKNIWVGTDGGGLYKYDRNKDVFKKIGFDKEGNSRLSSQHINCIIEFEKAIWIGTDNGLNKIETKNGAIKKYNFTDSGNNIISICGDGRGNLILGKEIGGVFRFYPLKGESIPILELDNVNKVYKDSRGIIWIGSEEEGLIKFEDDKNKFTFYKNSSKDSFSISDNFIMDIFEDSRENLWVGTYSGLNLYDYSENKFFSYKNNPEDPSSLSSNIINVIYEDRENVMWFGTQNAGLEKCIFFTRKFENYLNKEGHFDGSTILSIYEDKNETLWAGTFGGGLVKINLRNSAKKTYKYNPFNKQNISSDLVTNIYEDSNGILWVGTGNGGLNRFERKTETFKCYKKNPNPFSISGNFVTTIYEENKRTFWIGTYGSGINKFDPVTERFINWRHESTDTSGLTNNYVNTFIKDSRNDIWIGTIDGINKFDKEKNKFIREEIKPSETFDISKYEIHILFEDSQSRFWIGTFNGGLNLFDRDNKTITNYSIKDGLPSNDIYGILEDENGNLWISTQNGLSKFNFENNQFINFTSRDGLQNNEYSQNAYFKNKKGKMYFGGVNGFDGFYPSNILPNKKIPEIQITDFKLFNSTVEISSNSVLKKNITETDTIFLNFNKNSFSFEFTSLSLINPSENEYTYILEGHDAEWIKTNSDFRIATYSNVNSGEYTFHVKGSNNDGEWNNEGRKIIIIIGTAPWKTWWAFCTYIIIFSFGIWSIVKTQVKRVKKAELLKSEEREKIRKEMAEDFHDGTGDKLAQISLFSKFVRAQINSHTPEVEDALDWIVEASDMLKKETKDFLWSLDAEINSLFDLGIRLHEHGTSFFKKAESGISFEITGLKDTFKQIMLTMDWKRNLLFIFKEAMSNSFKYSKCTKVSLDFSLTANRITITYSDNGICFEHSLSNGGSGLKNMKNRSNKLDGKLIITSIPDIGNKIIFTGIIPP